ncbi:hypothetical protein GVX82_00760 [Patescibacteria group bacterium]|jgi:hypothetical protein|nr:hypothetical protein [Patescibacteria group bacterium]
MEFFDRDLLATAAASAGILAAVLLGYAATITPGGRHDQARAFWRALRGSARRQEVEQHTPERTRLVMLATTLGYLLLSLMLIISLAQLNEYDALPLLVTADGTVDPLGAATIGYLLILIIAHVIFGRHQFQTNEALRRLAHQSGSPHERAGRAAPLEARLARTEFALDILWFIPFATILGTALYLTVSVGAGV